MNIWYFDYSSRYDKYIIYNRRSGYSIAQCRWADDAEILTNMLNDRDKSNG